MKRYLTFQAFSKCFILNKLSSVSVNKKTLPRQGFFVAIYIVILKASVKRRQQAFLMFCSIRFHQAIHCPILALLTREQVL